MNEPESADGLAERLTPDESAQLAQYERERGDDRTVADYLSIYRQVADRMPYQDDWNVDDYLVALTIGRDQLASVLVEAPEPFRAKLAAVVEDADEGFRALTEEDSANLLRRFFNVEGWLAGREHPEVDAWWWKRIPTSGSVRNQLEDA